MSSENLIGVQVSPLSSLLPPTHPNAVSVHKFPSNEWEKSVVVTLIMLRITYCELRRRKFTPWGMRLVLSVS